MILFRKPKLRRLLALLIQRYGKNEAYSLAQIEKTMDLHRFDQRLLFDALALFSTEEDFLQRYQVSFAQMKRDTLQRLFRFMCSEEEALFLNHRSLDYFRRERLEMTKGNGMDYT